jgi:hypothetical protein
VGILAAGQGGGFSGEDTMLKGSGQWEKGRGIVVQLSEKIDFAKKRRQDCGSGVLFRAVFEGE